MGWLIRLGGRKFRLVVEEYDFKIQYIKRENNVVADALSRIYVNELKEICNKVSATVATLTSAGVQELRKETENRGEDL